MTQKQRILKALQAAGATGIRPEDFLLPDVVDGGSPILRVAARIEDLRKEGHTILTDTSGTTARYQLSGVEVASSDSRGVLSQPSSVSRLDEPDGATPSLFISDEPDFYAQDMEWV